MSARARYAPWFRPGGWDRVEREVARLEVERRAACTHQDRLSRIMASKRLGGYDELYCMVCSVSMGAP